MQSLISRAMNIREEITCPPTQLAYIFLHEIAPCSNLFKFTLKKHEHRCFDGLQACEYLHVTPWRPHSRYVVQVKVLYCYDC